MNRSIVQPLLNYITNSIILQSEEEEELISELKERSYLKGQYLVQQGDVCKYLSFVTKGCLKTFHVDKDGQEHIIRFSLENWWVADMGSYVSGEEADCSVQCLESTDVLQLSWEALQRLYEKIPSFEKLFRLIYQNAFVHAEKRITNSLSLTAKERYLFFQSRYPHIEQRVPQYMIASYLGVTKQYLSEIRNQIIHEQ